MKVLFVTDTHLTGRGPSSRTDNYVDAIFEKLEELKQVIQADGIDMVIHGGDVFDKPVVSYQLTGMLANFIRSTNVPWHVVPGNHDLFGYNLKSLPQTSLGLLQEAGVIEVLTRATGPLTFTADGVEHSFEGQEYHMDIDKRDPALDYYVSGNAKNKFLIPHSMLLDKNYFPGVPHTRTKDLAGKTDADYILVGHYHDGLTDTVMDGKRRIEVLNPGSMTRDEASKGNLKRRPGYVTIKLEKTPVIEYHEFQCAKDGNEVFDRSHITAKQSKDRYLQAFEQKLGDAPVVATDIRQVLDGLIQGSNGAIERRVADDARDRLSAAEQAIGDATQQMTGFVEKPGGLAIARMHIKGFQSHEDSLIEFGPGLNAIIGSSDSGKSSIIRALRFALYNEPRGADFIRHGATTAEVNVEFSDGSFLKRKRTQASAGSYIIGAPDGTETEIKGFANQLPVDIPNTHQMPRIQLTKDLEATLSIGYQMDGPFLIGESPGTRAAIIGKLAGVDLVDGAMREIGKEVLAGTKEMKRLQQEYANTASQLTSYSGLDAEKRDLSAAASALDELKGVVVKRDQLTLLASKWRAIVRDIVQAERERYVANQTLLHERDLTQAAQKLAKLTALHRLKRERDAAQAEMKKGQAMAEEAAHCLQHETETTRIHGLMSRAKHLQGIKREATALEQEINRMEATLREMPVLPELREVEALRLQQRKLRTLMDTQLAYTRLAEDFRNGTQKVERLRKTEGELAHAYQHILEEHGTCPTCSQTITKGETVYAN